MKAHISSLIVAVIVSLVSGVAMADGHIDSAIKARKAEMTLRAFNLGQLGAMAKGEIEYNSKAATTAARNLQILTTFDGSSMWLPGSDNVAMGDKTGALPALWKNFPKVMESVQALGAAATKMADVAGKDLASLRGAMGDVGKACGSCHKQFRAEMK